MAEPSVSTEAPAGSAGGPAPAYRPFDRSLLEATLADAERAVTQPQPSPVEPADGSEQAAATPAGSAPPSSGPAVAVPVTPAPAVTLPPGDLADAPAVTSHSSSLPAPAAARPDGAVVPQSSTGGSMRMRAPGTQQLLGSLQSGPATMPAPAGSLLNPTTRLPSLGAVASGSTSTPTAGPRPVEHADRPEPRPTASVPVAAVHAAHPAHVAAPEDSLSSIRPWQPSDDDILPARVARKGRFRLTR